MARTTDTNCRVYYMPSTLIAAWRKARDQQRSTKLAFVTEAIGKHLAPIIRELRAVGLTTPAVDRHAVRLEVSGTVLHDLGKAAEQTGVSATYLLGIGLKRASARKSRNRAPRAGQADVCRNIYWYRFCPMTRFMNGM